MSDLIREKFNRKNLNSSQLNTSTISNVSVYDDKQSPLCMKKIKNDETRIQNLKIASYGNRLKWHVGILTFITFDFFVLNSSIVSFLLFCNLIPSRFISYISFILLLYLIAVIILFSVEIIFPKVSVSVLKFFEATETKQSPSSAKKTNEKPPSRLNESIISTSDHSWIDAHKFGTPNTSTVFKGDSFRPSPFNKKSPNTSRIITNITSSDNSPLLNNSIIWKSPSAYVKPAESIHTRKQLEVLLKSHKNDVPVDINASQSSYFTSIWNVFDFGRNGPFQQNTTYQLSEELSEDSVNLNSPYKMKIGQDGRTEVTMLRRRRGTGSENVAEDDNDDDELTKLHKIMNAARTTPDSKSGILKRSNSTERGLRGGIRRRSQSSPDRSNEFYGGEADSRFRTGEILSEEQQKRAELNVRAWIRNTILLPLTEQIEEINKLLDREHTVPALKIGVSTVDALKLATIEKDSLKSSNLPFLLPFLGVHQNQGYLVNRIKELSLTEFMDVYKWNSGGMEPAEDKLQSSRIVRREWNETLPTDALLIFELFSVYMDAQLNSNCLVGDHRLDQPFTSQYVVKTPKKAIGPQKLPYSFYIYVASQSPPHFEFIHNDSNGSPMKCVIARQTSNLFRAIAQFLHYVKEENHGYLDQTNLGPTGINILCVLN